MRAGDDGEKGAARRKPRVGRRRPVSRSWPLRRRPRRGAKVTLASQDGGLSCGFDADKGSSEPETPRAVIRRVTPDELRKEADSTESLARLVSYQPDKVWLCAKAEELRRLADRLESRSWSPTGRGGSPRLDVKTKS